MQLWSELRELEDGIDYGTPPRQGSPVTLEVDGQSITVPSGSSVMLAAAKARRNIPKLCATDTLEAWGSCRLCLVEIEGRSGFPASCTTIVSEGMVVKTQSEKLQQLRKGVLELYLSDFPAEDVEGGWSEFHDMLAQCGVKSHPYEPAETHLESAVDASNPYFLFDPAKCIVCNRCVRACEEIQGTFALTIQGRGFDSKVAAGQDQTFFQSDCVSCGACVQTCPSQALVEKSLFEGEYSRG
ncbi:MAG: formate dehydrogenase [Hyphomicrobium sp.]|jgi:formate dehydrogenase major subunit|nr:formate dehydrogenase [Hyphomicrobium sp.]PPD06356.1 MAG: formate dehydrogenase [Hyphomicrobium sp.]